MGACGTSAKCTVRDCASPQVKTVHCMWGECQKQILAQHEVGVCEGTSARLGARTSSLSKGIRASCDHRNFILELKYIIRYRQ